MVICHKTNALGYWWQDIQVSLSLTHTIMLMLLLGLIELHKLESARLTRRCSAVTMRNSWEWQSSQE